MTKQPVLFLSHGSPMFAIEPGELGPRLTALGQSLRGVSAILVVSPHWQTRGLEVMTTARPQTVHDFGGFPKELYRLQYPAQGAPEVAQAIARALKDAGWPAQANDQQGLDHGAWVPLLYLRPEHDLPVFQVSLPFAATTEICMALGKALAPLREQGVLIIGSGSATHNLYELSADRSVGQEPKPYVTEFMQWVQVASRERNMDALLNYRELAPHASRAHPSEEHFLPLHVAYGASEVGDAFTVLSEEVNYGVISMESYAWGQLSTLE